MKTIKKLALINVLILFVLCGFMIGKVSAGEPIPGAEIFVELDSGPIANVTTNGNGEFMFTISNMTKIPQKGFFSVTINPPKRLTPSQEVKWSGMQKQKIQIPYNKKDGPTFKYVLTWNVDPTNPKAQSKGAFAVSGKSDAIIKPIETLDVR